MTTTRTGTLLLAAAAAAALAAPAWAAAEPAPQVTDAAGDARDRFGLDHPAADVLAGTTSIQGEDLVFTIRATEVLEAPTNAYGLSFRAAPGTNDGTEVVSVVSGATATLTFDGVLPGDTHTGLNDSPVSLDGRASIDPATKRAVGRYRLADVNRVARIYGYPQIDATSVVQAGGLAATERGRSLLGQQDVRDVGWSSFGTFTLGG
jgi:opacity protein-like surface antigen